MHRRNCLRPRLLELIIATFLVTAFLAMRGFAGTLVSPDRRVKVTFSLSNRSGKKGCLFYSVLYEGRALVAPSPLALAFKNSSAFCCGLKISRVLRSSFDRTYSPVYGERNSIRNHYNQAAVCLKETKAAGRKLTVVFRAYNEGIGFRYVIPDQEGFKNFTISEERTFFCFPEDFFAYAVYSAQGRYRKVRLSKIGQNCERPLTVETGDGLLYAVGEAQLVDYARMRLSGVDDPPHALVSSLGSEVEGSTPFSTPWRVVLVGRSPGELLERNYLFLNLNEPCALDDTSWIKPGKVIREVTLTTKGGMACVDFAVRHNLQYVEYDAGWYGHEYSGEADATSVAVDPKRSPGPLDLPAVIQYASKHGIGIILYVNRRALERQLDEILPLYRKWGIKGVKYGFVRVGSQRWTSWLHEAVRKAAEHHLMVDVHDEYRPTGYSRTYPNLMTQEGIRGNECMPSSGHNLILPFTRMLCGAGDYTICYYSDRIKTTHAHQLAASVVFYSPWQFLFWYDTPSEYKGEPEIEFFEELPTVWDDTEVVNGKIGEYITVARRSGGEWFIGSMTNQNARTLPVSLSFLEKGREYVAHIYFDGGEAVQTRTHVGIKKRIVDRSDTVKAHMPASGGHAVRLAPAVSKAPK